MTGMATGALPWRTCTVQGIVPVSLFGLAPCKTETLALHRARRSLGVAPCKTVLGYQTDKKQRWILIVCIEICRDHCVSGHVRRISCAFRRMLMRIVIPSKAQNAAQSRLVFLVVSARCRRLLRLSGRKTHPSVPPGLRMGNGAKNQRDSTVYNC